MVAIEHTVQGNTKTTYHDFTFTVDGMNVEISPGTYTQAGVELFSDETGVVLSFSTPSVDTHYEIWLNDEGAVLLMRTEGQEFGEVPNAIDRLAWFTIPAGTTDLANVEIHCMVMTEVAE